MEYEIINYPTMNDNTTVLKIIHNAGYFSCCSIGLMDIMMYFNRHQRLPEIVDRKEQFGFYKTFALDDLIPFYFREVHTKIRYKEPAQITSELDDFQFTDYKKIDFNSIRPFIYKFFTPSEHVKAIISHYEWKYQLDYGNTCAVFYRGNDKYRETEIAGYEQFIGKAHEILSANPDIKFLVQPDETEFLQAFITEFGVNRVICFEETPHMPKKDSCMFFELPQTERAEYGAKYNAAVICLSMCQHLITHSGNGGFWSVVYRGNGNNVHQVLNNVWL
jgi:hypothetical protein